MLFHLLPGLLLVIETCGVQGLFVRDQRLMGGQNMSGWPYFETNVARNVTTAIGQTAFLHCRVHQRGDKEVSWMRKRDMHILSAGISTYTSDLRFQVIHPDKSENWTLQIKSPQKRDSGTYECQVSTEPKMSLNYTLNVVEARARIMGPSDIYVKTGSSLTLTCLMSQGPHDLGTVAWYRENQHLDTSPTSENDVDSEPRITVETEWSEALTSRLRIIYAKLSDSGNYSCVPTVAEMATVKVHVINGLLLASPLVTSQPLGYSMKSDDCCRFALSSLNPILATTRVEASCGGDFGYHLNSESLLSQTMGSSMLPGQLTQNPTSKDSQQEEHPAAMQHGNTAAGSPTSRTILVTIAFLLGQLR